MRLFIMRLLTVAAFTAEFRKKFLVVALILSVTFPFLYIYLSGSLQNANLFHSILSFFALINASRKLFWR